MINLRYVFHPGSCGYFCLKHVTRKRNIKRTSYMSLYDLKKVLNEFNYYCMCVRVKDISDIKGKCITLLSIKNSYHYVVIKKINEKFIYVYDPLFLFVRKVRKSKFMRIWSKICLFYKGI